MKISRIWAMPSRHTFSVKPIGQFVKKYLVQSKLSVDPFAGDCGWAALTNDLNPGALASYNMKALDYLEMLERNKTRADLVIFDPPYSLRQAKECYEKHGAVFLQKDSQDVGHWREEKDIADRLLIEGGIFLSFGWSTTGIGKGEQYDIEEIMLVCHGGAHNDTICMAERKGGAAPRLIEKGDP